MASMARPIWSGAISFGLVNIPVKVLSGVRDHSLNFHQVDKKTGSRIRYEKVAEKTGKHVEADQIIDSLSGPWKPERYHDTYTIATESISSTAGLDDERLRLIGPSMTRFRVPAGG
jgi:non-homologous end joining protein Ku